MPCITCKERKQKEKKKQEELACLGTYVACMLWNRRAGSSHSFEGVHTSKRPPSRTL